VLAIITSVAVTEMTELFAGDLDFVPHPSGFQGRKLFDNNFGISVIPEGDKVTYEVAILAHKEGKRPQLCYDSGLTTDVFRFLTVDEVRDLISKVQKL